MSPSPDDRTLVLQRVVPITPEAAWKAWTDPHMLMQWFTPAPWKTVACEIDLRPGGIFSTSMQGPNGEHFSGAGCFLEVQAPSRLVWTSALGPGYMPNPAAAGAPVFTCVLSFTPQDSGTLYEARALHADAETAKAHAEMGFHVGWSAALDQLVALVKNGN